MSYKKGDVVVVKFPYREQDGTIITKVRPALVYDIDPNNNHPLIQITTRNHTGRFSGFWVTKNSFDGQTMGILHDSFIQLKETYRLPESYIIRKIGDCLFMDKIDRAMRNLRMKIKDEPK